MNSLGLDINQKYSMSSIAVCEALAGLSLMMLITSRVIKRNFHFSFEELARGAAKWDTRKVLLLYLFSTIFLSSLGFVLGMTSGFTQVLFSLSGLKWIFLLLYGFIIWSQKKSSRIFWIICLFEFLASFYSFFSDFKTIILMVIMIVIPFTRKINLKTFFIMLLSGILLGLIFVTWTAVKGEYRLYLNSGKRQQVVNVERGEAYENLIGQFKSLSKSKYEKSLVFSFYRLQYILHLARVMERIPEYMPHENGNLWLSNIKYALTPRILNPDKGFLDPSVKTNKYTGFRYATGKQGTSFSLGYFSESYVDFGHFGMFFPLMLIALCVGGIYNVIMSFNRLNILLRYAVVSVLLLTFSSFEVDGIFLIGRLLMNFIVMLAFCHFVFPRIQKWAYLKK